MAEHPRAGDVWGARYRRAWDRVGVKDKVARDLYHELLEASADGLRFVLLDGRWTENPHHGNREYYAAERRRLWGELGELLGIGPPPNDFLR